jgi:beta-lactamase regulating signal transducer with metallopeptidase domain
MNDLGLLLVGAAFRVTLLALAAAALYAIAARRGPGAASPVAAACLGGSVVLTLLALCPLPSWWAWQATPPAAPAAGAPTPDQAPAVLGEASPDPENNPQPGPHGEGIGLSWFVGWLRQGWGRMDRATASSPVDQWNGSGILAVLFLTGMGLYLLRLALGLWAIRTCCRRSRLIVDAALNELAESLRVGLGCSRRVEVRASDDLATPATVGWRRPVVLLPADWRSWREPELRAVLAHELAHVSRSDFLTGLLARVGVALHFYHPVLHWMAGRLHLQQELAADALGARFAGGRAAYLAALARLALRQDGRPASWLGKALFSSHGTLMRRIHMLRVREGFGQPSLPRRGRVLLMGLLVVVTAGVSALRSPAQKAEEPAKELETPGLERFYAGGFHSLRGFAYRGAGQEFRIEEVPGTQLQRNQTGEREPFDLTWIDPDAMGIVSFRPAAVLGRPALKKYADLLNKEIAKGLATLEVPDTVQFHAEEIEQVVCTHYIKTDTDADKAKQGGQSMHLFAGPFMIRMTKAYDWKKLLDALVPGSEEVNYQGKTYWRLTAIGIVQVLVSRFDGDKGNPAYYLPDGRTLVLDSEENLRRLIGRKAGDPTDRLWADAWKRVERNVAAVVFDNRSGRWTKELAARSEPEPALVPFYKNANWIMFGFDGVEDFQFQAFAGCATERGGEILAKATEAALAKGREALAAEVKEGKGGQEQSPEGAERMACQFLIDLFANPSLEHDGKMVTLLCVTKKRFDEVIEAFIKEEMLQVREERTPEKKP